MPNEKEHKLVREMCNTLIDATYACVKINESTYTDDEIFFAICETPLQYCYELYRSVIVTNGVNDKIKFINTVEKGIHKMIEKVKQEIK